MADPIAATTPSLFVGDGIPFAPAAFIAVAISSANVAAIRLS